jgi:hypothetical protein
LAKAQADSKDKKAAPKDDKTKKKSCCKPKKA